MKQKQTIKNRIKAYLYRNRRYKIEQREGLNVLTETEESKAKRAERREILNMLFTFISAFAAVIAAIFAALTYINS